MVIYLDIVIAFNFAVDFLLLISANRLTGYSSHVKRCLTGAAIGGVYSGLCLVPAFGLFQSWYFCVLVLCAIAITSFGWKVSAIRRGALFVLLSMTLGGIASGFNGARLIPILLSGIAILLLCTVGIADTLRGTKYVKAELTWKGKKYPLIALADTGNTLKDPISGTQVLVVNPQIALSVFQLTQHQLLNPIETMQRANIPGLRLIPYRSVGHPNGMMLGVSMDSVIINGQHIGKVIAFSPEDFGTDVCYQALAGGVV